MEINTEGLGKSKNSLAQLLYRYLPYWPLFLLFVLISCAAAWNYIRHLTPKFQATASILIKDDAEGAGESKIMESLNVLIPKKSIQNEIEVIQSRSLMNEVVTKLHLYAAIYEEKSIKPASAYATSPIIIKLKEPEKLQEANKILFSYNDQVKTVTLQNKSYLLDVWCNTPYGVMMFVTNPFKTENATNSLYFNLIRPNKVANYLRSNLSVSPSSKSSSLLVLRLVDEVPRRAEDVLNALAELYGRASIDSKNELAANTLAFLNDRIKYVEEDLDSLERMIQQYKSDKRIVDLSTQGQLFLKNIADNDQRVADLQLQLIMLNQVEQYVVSKDSRNGVVPSMLGVSAPLLSDLLQRLYNAEIQYDKMRNVTAANNPALLTIKSEIERIRPSILENIRDQRSNIRATINNITASNNAYVSRVGTIPQKEKALLDFSRRQAIKSSVYTFLLQKKEETALSHAATVANNQLIDAAESSMLPYSPQKSVIYMLAVVFGLISGVVLVSVREIFSTKVLFRSEIENYTSIPIVSELIKVKSKCPLVVNLPKHVFLAEQFRLLRTTIGLYGKMIREKKILVTSSISGEGKSFVCVNLALSLALAGKKVVLLDLDLCNPVTSETFGLASSKGIREFCVHDIEPFEIIKETDFDQLFVIPAGAIFVNSTEVLLNGKLDILLDYLMDKFDCIIADTSPVDPVTDAYALSAYFDHTLFVIRHGYTPKTVIQMLHESNKVKALKNMVIVFNGVKSRGFIRKGYGFGYGYGYENVYKDRTYKGNVKSESV